MSHTATNWAWGHHVPTREKLVLLYLAFRANNQAFAFPGKKDIARHCSCSLSSVHRAISLLVEWGLVEVTHQYTREDRQTSNIYHLRLDRLEVVSFVTNEYEDHFGEDKNDREGVTADSPRESLLTPRGVTTDSPSCHADTLGGVTADSPNKNLNKEQSPPFIPPKWSAGIGSNAQQRSKNPIACAIGFKPKAVSEKYNGLTLWHLQQHYKNFGFAAFFGDRKRAGVFWEALQPSEKTMAIANFPRYAAYCKQQFSNWKKLRPAGRSRKPAPATAAQYCEWKLFDDQSLLSEF